MTVTFLVALNLDDITALAETATDIEDALAGHFNIVSVKSWARPTSQTPFQSLPPLIEPTTNQPQPTTETNTQI